GATSLAALGVSADCIQAIGCWSSDSFQIYVQKNLALLHALIFNSQSIHDSVAPFDLIQLYCIIVPLFYLYALANMLSLLLYIYMSLPPFIHWVWDLSFLPKKQ
ncbi:uncharacterized protein F5147DRAFT_581301, partial [Suillus discolor]